MIAEIVKEITLEQLQETQVGDRLLSAMKKIEKAQETLLVYVNDDSREDLKLIRIGTVLAFAIINKVVSGKSIGEFGDEEWMEIAEQVADYAILIDGQTYSTRIFLMYAKYVDVSVEVLRIEGITNKKLESVTTISGKIRDLTDEVMKGKISEVEYTEQCLWLLLEAMIKMLCINSTLLLGEDKSEFLQSVSMLAFEYGRYTLYKQERDLIGAYLEHQSKLDDEIQLRLDEYNKALRERQQEFDFPSVRFQTTAFQAVEL